MANALVPVPPMKRTSREWRDLVKAYGKRSCTRDEFCRRHGVAVSTLDWWRRKFDGKASTARVQKIAPSTGLNFIDLTPSPADRPGWDIELDLGTGLVLRLRRS